MISFLILFLELACIRWFGSYVVFLTFFTNVVLLASFVGMSIGCLAASRKANFIRWTPAIALLSVSAALGIRLAYSDQAIAIDVGPQVSPERVYFGTGHQHPDPGILGIPVEAIAGFFFILIVLMFIGLGQVLGRQLEAIPNRVVAYSTNILGSLAGILAFGLMSFLWLSPFWWFLVALGGCCFFITGAAWPRTLHWACAAVTIVLVGLAGNGMLHQLAGKEVDGREIIWSPYYRVDFIPKDRDISVNSISHQGMLSHGSQGIAYALPYLLSQDSGRRPVQDVLIIGAGSGNDTSAALAAGALRVDAVEIDPAILSLGKHHHPDRPYQDARVKVHAADGRNFLKETDRKYDVIVYALVDSLILHSGYSSIRLENFLFTQQAFADVKDRLKPGGLFVMYNYYRQGWIIERLQRMAADTFGQKPLIFNLPYRAEIPADINTKTDESTFTMVLAGDTEPIRKAFDGSETGFWIPKRDYLNDNRSIGFGVSPSPQDHRDWVRIGPSAVAASAAGEALPADHWPFLYTKNRQIPGFALRGIALMGGLSLLILWVFTPKGTGRFNWTLFFLGAGFMLLETKSVVHLALLFGSTWIVNSIVFFAILVMILLSNLVVLRFRPERLKNWYLALLACLVLNVFVDLEVFLGLPGPLKYAGACAIVFVPIFFAGVIFATHFRHSAQPDHDFGANIAGVVLGGLAENASLILGFQHLVWVAVGFYLLSWVAKPRSFTSIG